MKRRSRVLRPEWPPELAAFDPARWLEPDETELMVCGAGAVPDLREWHAMRRWVAARNAWEAANGQPSWDELIAALSVPL